MACNLSKDCPCSNTIQENCQPYPQPCQWIKQLAIFQLEPGSLLQYDHHNHDEQQY